jgi:hypothetical protein
MSIKQGGVHRGTALQARTREPPRLSASQGGEARKNSGFIVPLTRWRVCTRCMREAKCALLHAPTLVSCWSSVGLWMSSYCTSCQLAVRWISGRLARLSVAHPFQLVDLPSPVLSTMGESAAVSLYCKPFLLCCSAVMLLLTDVRRRLVDK